MNSYIYTDINKQKYAVRAENFISALRKFYNKGFVFARICDIKKVN